MVFAIKIKVLSLFVLAVLLGSAFAFYGGGTSDSGTKVEVFVTGACMEKDIVISVSSSGSPVQNAQVTISKLSKEKLPIKVTEGKTDSNGIYSFVVSEPGSYQAEVKGTEIRTETKQFMASVCNKMMNTNLTKPDNAKTSNGSDKNTSNLGVDVESSFKCKDLEGMKDRIKCRLKLPSKDEQELKYLPEECRILEGKTRTSCINRYALIQRCRHLEKDGDRNNCYLAETKISAKAANITKIKNDSKEKGDDNKTNKTQFKTRRDECKNNSSCIDDLREEVFGFVKFRLYTLEEKIEKLKDRGWLSEDDAVVFIEFIEKQKQEFSAADGVEAKKAVIQKIQDEWKVIKEKIVKSTKSSKKDKSSGVNSSNSTASGENNE